MKGYGTLSCHSCLKMTSSTTQYQLFHNDFTRVQNAPLRPFFQANNNQSILSYCFNLGIQTVHCTNFIVL